MGSATAALAVALLAAGCGGAQAPSAGPSAGPSSSAAWTDATACETFGERGVEARLSDAYGDDDASQALVAEYAGAPAFQEALRQTVELLRSSGGELEGDFLAAACADQTAG